MRQLYPDIHFAIINDVNPNLTIYYQTVSDTPDTLPRAQPWVMCPLAFQPAPIPSHYCNTHYPPFFHINPQSLTECHNQLKERHLQVRDW